MIISVIRTVFLPIRGLALQKHGGAASGLEQQKSSGGTGGPGGGDLQLWRDPGAGDAGSLLLAVAVMAWVAAVRQAAAMPALEPGADMGAMPMPAPSAASPVPAGELLGYLAAWGVMMAAMMLPSATPMIAFYGALRRKSAPPRQPGLPTAGFAIVYLVVWIAFGVPVYLASAALTWAIGMYPAAAGTRPYAVAVVLLAAGLYQFSSFKRACLRACQSPVGFLMGHWRGGYGGTLRLAGEHAAYCVGCCWGLMLVLVAAGAMSLPWVLLIAVVVFAEKLFPRGQWLARVVGGALIVMAVLILVQPGWAALLRGTGL